MGRQGSEPRKRASPGCRRAPNTRQATATTPRRQGVAAPGGVGAPGPARPQWVRDPGGPGTWPGLSPPGPRGAPEGHGRDAREQGVGQLHSPDEATAQGGGPHDDEASSTGRSGGGRGGQGAGQGEAGSAPQGPDPAPACPATCARPETPGSAAGPRAAVTARWHHVYESHRLREASDGLHHDAAPGVDGQTWAASGETLAAHLQDLSDRLQHGGSPARPVARVSSPQPAASGPSASRPWKIKASRGPRWQCCTLSPRGSCADSPMSTGAQPACCARRGAGGPGAAPWHLGA